MEKFSKAKKYSSAGPIYAQHPFAALALCSSIRFSALTSCSSCVFSATGRSSWLLQPQLCFMTSVSTAHCPVPSVFLCSHFCSHISRENLINFMLLLHQTMPCITGQPTSQLPLGQMANIGSISWHGPKHNCSLR